MRSLRRTETTRDSLRVGQRLHAHAIGARGGEGVVVRLFGGDRLDIARKQRGKVLLLAKEHQRCAFGHVERAVTQQPAHDAPQLQRAVLTKAALVVEHVHLVAG